MKRPEWLPTSFVALTAFDTLHGDRTSQTVQQVPLYLEAKRIAGVAERAPGGTAVLVDGVWAAVVESPQDVFAAITNATR